MVLHPTTKIGENVTVYHNVTVGRADSWVSRELEAEEGVLIEDDSVLCPGAVVLFRGHQIKVARGTVLAANSVLLESTGVGEIWGGIPARRLGLRRDYP